MKKFLKVLLYTLMIIIIGLLAITMVVISVNSEKIPVAKVNSSQSEVIMTTGNYDWNAFTQVLKRENYNYVFDDTLIASPGETVTISLQQQVGQRLFEISDVHYYDSLGNQYETSIVSQDGPIDSYANRYIEQLIVPDRIGTYFYYITMNFHEKGTVEYAFKAYVTNEANYNIEELLNYKKTSLLDYEGIQKIINILPYSKNIRNMVIRSSAVPTRLMIYYSEFLVDRSQYTNHAIALFALIPELDIVEYSSPDGYYIFSRDEMELIQGRDLEEYSLDADLWKKEVILKEKENVEENSFENAITQIIAISLDLKSGEPIDYMSIDDASFSIAFDEKASKLSERKMYNNLMNYSKNIVNTDYNTYKEQNHKEPFVMLSKIDAYELPSGDIVYESGENNIVKKDLHNVETITLNSKKEERKTFELYTQSGDWIISEVH